VAEYSPSFQAHAAEELRVLPDGSVAAEMLVDTGVMRVWLGRAGVAMLVKNVISCHLLFQPALTFLPIG
jgi:hypothetical protein